MKKCNHVVDPTSLTLAEDTAVSDADGKPASVIVDVRCAKCGTTTGIIVDLTDIGWDDEDDCDDT